MVLARLRVTWCLAPLVGELQEAIELERREWL